jgi:poly-beta-1,6-N-acetyl-D-glucosamine N-deacetylase
MEYSLRNVITWLLANILIICGRVRRAKERAMSGEFILSMYFHDPSREEFEACVKWLMHNHFTFLSIQDVYRLIQQNMPLPKGAVLLTVDDGWKDNERNIVEVANKYRVPVAIFVSTEAVEEGAYWWSYLKKAKDLKLRIPPKASLKMVPNDVRLSLINKIKGSVVLEREAMTIDQIRRISESEYITIAGHTHSHPILTNCGNDQLYAELKVSKDKLQEWTGKEISFFAYPNGDYSKKEMQALHDLDYKLAFSSVPKPLTLQDLKNNYCLPRFGILEGASFAENLCRMMGVWKPMMLKLNLPPFKKSPLESAPVYSSKEPEVLVS